MYEDIYTKKWTLYRKAKGDFDLYAICPLQNLRSELAFSSLSPFPLSLSYPASLSFSLSRVL